MIHLPQLRHRDPAPAIPLRVVLVREHDEVAVRLRVRSLRRGAGEWESECQACAVDYLGGVVVCDFDGLRVGEVDDEVGDGVGFDARLVRGGDLEAEGFGKRAVCDPVFVEADDAGGLGVAGA